MVKELRIIQFEKYFINIFTGPMNFLFLKKWPSNIKALFLLRRIIFYFTIIEINHLINLIASWMTRNEKISHAQGQTFSYSTIS